MSDAYIGRTLVMNEYNSDTVVISLDDDFADDILSSNSLFIVGSVLNCLRYRLDELF